MASATRLALVMVVFALSLAAWPAHADDPILPPDAIVGVWETEHEDRRWSHIEITSKDGKIKWEDGRIYDPKSGKTYRCKATMKDADTLEIYGYVKVGFVNVGRNTTWTRVPEGS